MPSISTPQVTQEKISLCFSVLTFEKHFSTLFLLFGLES